MRHTVSVTGDAADEVRRIVEALECGAEIDASRGSAEEREEAEERLSQAIIAWRGANPNARFTLRIVSDTLVMNTDQAEKLLSGMNPVARTTPTAQRMSSQCGFYDAFLAMRNPILK